MFKMTLQPQQAFKKTASSEKIESLAFGIETNKLSFFCPNGAQEELIRVFANSLSDTKIPVILCTFANGVGKTTIGINVVLNLIYGVQNGWFDYQLFKNWPFPKTIWYCSTAEAITDTIVPMFEEYIQPNFQPDRYYTKNKEGKRIVSRMEFPKQGWTVQFKTFDQDPKTYESATVGLIIADEPMPENLWKAIKSRRRKGCIVLLPMTPLYCPPYVIDELTKNEKGYYHLQASVYEACERRGIRGHLDPDIVDDMVSNYDSEEREARAYGQFMYFSGRIYKRLDEQVHKVSPEKFPIPQYARIVHVVDPHDSRPAAAIWGAICPNGRKIIFDEYPFNNDRFFWDMKGTETVQAELEAWLQKEGDHKVTIAQRILDKHFGWQRRGQKTFAELYFDEGIKLKKNITFMPSYTAGVNSDGEIAFGHRIVRKLLEPMEDGFPGLVIWDTCYHTWNGMTHYIRKHLTGKSADDRIEADSKIVEKYKDFPDCIRYFCCSDVIATEPKKKETLYDKRLKLVSQYPRKSSFT